MKQPLFLLPVFLMPLMVQGRRMHPEARHHMAVVRTRDMIQDAQARELVKKAGLDILNVTWEDTGRYKNSAVGPNISDMTIQVATRNRAGQQTVHCMPVIRFPNFSDKTADVDPDAFFLKVGNEKGQPLRSITLTEFLKHPTLYLHDAGSWTGPGRRSLFAPKRDSRVLVSAQACFLPVPFNGKATFNPVLFNYQSMEKDPAVLTVLVTPEGTSVTVIDNTRDAFETGAVWGQRLFFNQNGQRASLTGERESEVKLQKPLTDPVSHSGEEKEPDMHRVLLIQIPLKQKNPIRHAAGGEGGGGVMFGAVMPMAEMDRSTVENAVIGYGELEGPFTEIDRLEIERDDRFPVRVTVQFYKATSNGVLAPEDLEVIKSEIASVYEQGDAIGSLVTDGDTGRVTEYDGPKVQPADWWDRFWERHEQNTGDSRKEAIRKLRKLLGPDYQTMPVDEPFLERTLESVPVPDDRKVEKPGIMERLFGG